MTHTLRSTEGLTRNRIDWRLPCNNACVQLAKRGLGYKAIQTVTLLTPGQIAYRCRKRSVSPLDFRRGTNTVAITLLNRFSVLND